MSIQDDINRLREEVHYEEDLISDYQSKIYGVDNITRYQYEQKISMLQNNISTFKMKLSELENKYYSQTYGKG